MVVLCLFSEEEDAGVQTVPPVQGKEEGDVPGQSDLWTNARRKGIETPHQPNLHSLLTSLK